MARRRSHLLLYAALLLLLILIGAGLLEINAQAKEELETYASLDSANCVPDVPGMVGYWPMDEGPGASTFVDLINPGVNDATCAEGKCPDSTAGKIGGAFDFLFVDDPVTPSGDEVNAPDFDALDWAADGSFSIETWVKIPSTLTCETLETRKVFVGRRFGGISIWLGCANGDKAVFSVRDSLMTQSTATSETSINDGQWHHVVGVQNGTTSETLVYVDGDASTPDVVTFAGDFSSTAKLNFGWFNVEPYYWLTGSLDEIAVYNRAITADEISGHYSGGQGQTYCDDAPVIAAVPAQVNDEGDSVLVTVTAQDPEGHDFTLSATGMPPGIVFDPVSGQFSGTISYLTHIGPDPYNVTITAQETMQGGLAGTQSFNWTVNDVNRPPVLTTPGTQNSTEGQLINLQIAASDPDADNTLIFSAENLPPGLEIDPTTGVIGGFIAFNAAPTSPYQVKLTVTDAALFSDHVALTVETTLSWHVEEADAHNYLPVIGNGGQP